MFKYYIRLSFLLISSSSFAQEERVDTAMINKIRDEGFNHSQIAAIAHQLTDVSGARLTNSPGYMRAARWAVGEMKKWGLANSKLEKWGEFGKGWELQKNYVALKSPYYQPLIAYTQAWSSGTKGLVRAQVVGLDKMDSVTIKKEAASLKGKIVFVSNEFSHLRPAFVPYATRYTDSQLTHMGDLYYFTRSMAEFSIPMMERMKNIHHKLRKTF